LNAKNKVILAVVLFVIAGGIAAYNLSAGNKTALDESGRVMPDDAKMVDAVCVGNGAHVKLPPESVKTFARKKGRTRAGQKPSSELEPPQQYDCADCPSGKAVLAIFCDECNKFIARKKPDGTPNDCSDCWD